MEILQTKEAAENVYKRDPNTVEAYIRTNANGAYLTVYFGANVTHAKMYVVGVDNGKPVLVPAEQGGYGVSNRHPGQAGTMRFKLADNVLDVFGADVAAGLRSDIRADLEIKIRLSNLKADDNPDSVYDGLPEEYGDVDLTATIDDSMRVWLACNNAD